MHFGNLLDTNLPAGVHAARTGLLRRTAGSFIAGPVVATIELILCYQVVLLLKSTATPDCSCWERNKPATD